jgi:hypothetical protein
MGELGVSEAKISACVVLLVTNYVIIIQKYAMIRYYTNSTAVAADAVRVAHDHV